MPVARKTWGVGGDPHAWSCFLWPLEKVSRFCIWTTKVYQVKSAMIISESWPYRVYTKQHSLVTPKAVWWEMRDVKLIISLRLIPCNGCLRTVHSNGYEIQSPIVTTFSILVIEKPMKSQLKSHTIEKQRGAIPKSYEQLLVGFAEGGWKKNSQMVFLFMVICFESSKKQKHTFKSSMTMEKQPFLKMYPPWN